MKRKGKNELKKQKNLEQKRMLKTCCNLFWLFIIPFWLIFTSDGLDICRNWGDLFGRLSGVVLCECGVGAFLMFSCWLFIVEKNSRYILYLKQYGVRVIELQQKCKNQFCYLKGFVDDRKITGKYLHFLIVLKQTTKKIQKNL